LKVQIFAVCFPRSKTIVRINFSTDRECFLGISLTANVGWEIIGMNHICPGLSCNYHSSDGTGTYFFLKRQKAGSKSTPVVNFENRMERNGLCIRNTPNSIFSAHPFFPNY